jgi:hypothetical protein
MGHNPYRSLKSTELIADLIEKQWASLQFMVSLVPKNTKRQQDIIRSVNNDHLPSSCNIGKEQVWSCKIHTWE